MRIRATFALLLIASFAAASEHEVTGRVLSLDNVPIAGVNVLLMGTSKGTATDMNGYFRINLPGGRVVLAFLFLKQKPFEHAFDIRPGFQYQINVNLANKSQTFNKGFAETAELPLDCPVVRGRVTDQDLRPLYGVNITQSNAGFRTITDAEGNFFMPVPAGTSNIRFRFPGTKEAQVEIEPTGETLPELEVIMVQDKARYRMRQSTATFRLTSDTQHENNN